MKPGSHITVTTKQGNTFTGTVLPGDGLVLKLDDGYNIGIDERNIKDVTPAKAPKKKTAKTPPVKKDKKKPKVLLLHTGGTIASKVDYESGGVKHLFEPEEILAFYPELQDVACVDAEAVASMYSEDFRLAHFNTIAKHVELAVKKGYTGVIVTTGTDYMHYAGAALHYLLQGIPIPVVLTGSQRSSDRGSSDSFTNLSAAVQFITETAFPGVFIAMHEHSGDEAIHVLRGINARKMHSSRRDAFRAINIPAVARVTKKGVSIITEPPKPKKAFRPARFNEKLKIGVCLLHPQFFAEALDVYTQYDALILVGSGLGHAPVNMTDEKTREHQSILKRLEALAERMPVVITTQCLHGRTNLQVYSTGRKMLDAGVLGHDLAYTYETLFCKLAFILSTKMGPEAIAEDFGDVIDRTEEGTYE